MPAYVPPHLRNRGNSQSESAPPSPAASRPTSYDKTDIRRILKVATYYDIHTLTVSSVKGEEPEKSELQGIVLYREQHPDWPSARQILCKSNLDVLEGIRNTLPESPESALDSPCSRPIYPVFEESKDVWRGRFTFSGWFRISSIEIIEAHSPRLIEIFSRKFVQDGQETERSEEAWRESFHHRWAVVTFEKDDTRLDQPPKLTSNVNDLLKASRQASAAPSRPMISNAA